MSTAEPQTKPAEGDVELHNRMRVRRERWLWIVGVIAALVIGWATATLTAGHPRSTVATEPNANCPGVFLPNGTPVQTPAGNVKAAPTVHGARLGSGVGTSVPSQPTGVVTSSPAGRAAGSGYATTGPTNAPSGAGVGGAAGPGGVGSGITGGTYGMGSAPEIQGGSTAPGASAGNGIVGGGSLTPGTNGIGTGGSVAGGGNGVNGTGSFAGGTTGVGGIGTGAGAAGTGIGGVGGFNGSGSTAPGVGGAATGAGGR